MSRKAASIKRIVPLFVGIGNLLVHAWFAIVEILAVHLLLGMLFTDQYIQGIFPTERKIVLRRLMPVTVTATKTAVNLIYKDGIVLNGN